MCKKRCKKRPAPQAAHGAQQQQHRTKTRKRSSCAPKQSRDGASCIEALDPQSTAAAIQAACAERDLVRKRALLEQLVEACSSSVTSAPMSQVAADELYAQRADLGPNPSKGRALAQEELLDTWAGELGAWLAELDARVDDVADIAGKFLARNSGAQSAGQWHTDNVLQVTDEPTHRAVAPYGQGQVGLEFRFKADGDDSVTVKVLTPIGSMQIVSRALLPFFLAMQRGRCTQENFSSHVARQCGKSHLSTASDLIASRAWAGSEPMAAEHEKPQLSSARHRKALMRCYRQVCLRN